MISPRVIDALAKDRPDGLYVIPDHFVFTQRERVVEFTAKNRIPAMYGLREYALAGGLMAIGAKRVDMYRRAASYVDRILKGAHPPDLPIELPTTRADHQIGRPPTHSASPSRRQPMLRVDEI